MLKLLLQKASIIRNESRLFSLFEMINYSLASVKNYTPANDNNWKRSTEI